MVLFNAGVGLACYNRCAFTLVSIRLRAYLCEVLSVDAMAERYSVNIDPLLGGLFFCVFRSRDVGVSGEEPCAKEC